MKKRIKGFLRKATVALGVSALKMGIFYLLFGWGLSASDREASYRFIEDWSEANGQAFEEPFAITVDPRNGNVLVTDTAAQRVVRLDEAGRLKLARTGFEPATLS